MDKVKGAIFNMIAERLGDALVLDLFAGSGSLGIEALSRGASKAIFVDKNKQSINIIKNNLEHTKLDDKALVINQEVDKIYHLLPKELTKFDIIFMDPPYNKNFVQKTLIFLDNNGILKESGVIIAEHAKEDILPKRVGNLENVREKQYGITSISFYKYIKEE